MRSLSVYSSVNSGARGNNNQHKLAMFVRRIYFSTHEVSWTSRTSEERETFQSVIWAAKDGVKIAWSRLRTWSHLEASEFAHRWFNPIRNLAWTLVKIQTTTRVSRTEPHSAHNRSKRPLLARFLLNPKRWRLQSTTPAQVTNRREELKNTLKDSRLGSFSA